MKDDTAVGDGCGDLQVGREEKQVGDEAGGDATAFVVDTQESGGGGGDGGQGFGKRAAGVADQIAQGLVNGQHAAGQGAVGEAAVFFADEDFEIFEPVLAGGHAQSANGVADQIETRAAFGSPDEPDQGGVDVDAIGD